MKIDLQSIDRTNFIVAEHLFHGEPVYLVIPNHIGAKFTKDNLHLRSSVWNAEGELISASFPKFFNWGEHPELTSLPSTLKDAHLVEKLDGSTLIVSKYKGQFMIRTRGTTDATKMEKNGYEIEFLMDKYPKIKTLVDEDTYDDSFWNFSIIAEWVSPINQIVIRYDEPDIRLIGVINHEDYSLWTQQQLDELSKVIEVNRPKTFNFNTIEEMIASIESLKGQEGIVVYFNNDQSLLKVKAAEYLAKHRFKSEATLENTLELFFAMGKPNYQDFEAKLIEQFDYECFNMVRGYASQVCEITKEVNNLVQKMGEFVIPLKSLPRKDAAIKITSSFGTTGRSGMCFTLLDSRPLTIDQIRKLYWQFLKK